MPSLFSQPIVCPILVGREPALAHLSRLHHQAAQRGVVALISGEAGIGKTRLLGEFLARRSQAGTRSWRVRFFEQDAGLPYSGFTRLLTDLASGVQEGGQLLTAFANELRAIAPDSFVHAAVAGQAAEEAEPDPEAERRRVVEGLRKLTRSLCANGPAVFAFEDVHWADSSSLVALLEIARDATPGCFIILTYRNDERSPALDAALAELDRERLAAEVRLSRLGLAEVDTMLSAILGSAHPTRADILHLVNQLTQGNPFFVEEVLRSILDQAGGIEALEDLSLADFDIPRGVAEAVRRRREGLSPAAREVLSLAAVAGVRFDFPLLLELSGRSEDDLLVLIKELVAGQLVVEEAEDQFAFRHALTREAVRSELLLRERRSLSRRIAQAIETSHAGELDAHVEDLAWHFHQAGEWPHAFKYSRQAGERAMALYAPAAAQVHLTRAIDAGRRLDNPGLAEVYRLRGSAGEAIGNFDGARADYERAAELAQASGETRVHWQALIDLGLLWASRDYSRSEPYYRAALELARGLDPAALGHSLNRLGNWYSNIGDFESARALSEEALSTFRDAGDQLGVAQTLDLLGMACLQDMRFEPAVAYYREAIDLLERLGDRRTLTSALASIQVSSSTYQTWMLPPALPLAEASKFGERAITLSRSLGWKSAESYALWQSAFCLGPQGEYIAALDYGHEALGIARQIGHTQWEVGAECALGAVYADTLAVDEARNHLQRAAALCKDMGSSKWADQVNALLIDTLLAARDVEAAAQIFDSGPPPEPGGFGSRELFASGAELAFARGDLRRTFSMLDALAADAVAPAPGLAAVRLARLRGRALAASGEIQTALASLREAVEAARLQGNLSYLWRLHTDLAHVLHQAGDREAARMEASQAMEVVDTLAQRIPDERLRGNFVARAVEHLPPALRRRSGRDHVERLTAREAEIGRLIARGLTNREIADELVLGVRTVETHVANAMAKLGFTTRSQLAAWVVEHGPAGSDT